MKIDKITFTITLGQDGLRQQCDVTYTGKFIPGDPGVHTFSNGDPGYPPSPAEFDIESIEVNGDVSLLIEDIQEYVNKEFTKFKTQVMDLIGQDHPSQELLRRFDAQFKYAAIDYLEDKSIEIADDIDSHRFDNYPEWDQDGPDV